MFKHFLHLSFFLVFTQAIFAQNPTIAICSGSQYICTTSNNQEICVEIKIDPTNPTWQKFEIDWGDGTSKTTILGTTPQPIQVKHTYNLNGFYNTCTESKEYTVKLLSYKTTGIPANNAFFFSFKNKPIATFSGPSPICKDKSIIFKIYDPNNPNSWPSCPPFNHTWTIKWDYGDSSPIDDKGIHTYKQKGTYTIKLTTENECGIASSQQTITTYGDPLTKIVADSGFVMPLTDPLKVCLGGGGLVKINGITSENATKYTWDLTPSFGYVFSKNTNKNSPIPYIVFSQPGNYTLKLTVDNECNKPSTVAKNITVIAADNLQLFAQADACKSLSYSPLPFNSKAKYYINGQLQTSFPMQLSVGKYSIKATLDNECGSQEEVDEFEVIQPEAITIKMPTKDTTLCLGTAKIELLASPAGGTWTGSIYLEKVGTKTFFNPQSVGTFTLTYTRGSGSCEQKASIKITVIDDVKLTLPHQPDVCNSLSYKPQGFNPNATYELDGTVINNAAFPIIILASTKKHFVIATFSGNCGKQILKDSFTVLLLEPVVLQIKDTTICLGTSKLELLVTPLGGNWTGSIYLEKVGTKTFFNPQSVGTFTLTYTRGSGSCEQKASVKITVIDDIKLTLPHQLDVCNSLSYKPQDFNPNATYELDGTVIDNSKFPITIPASAKKHFVIATFSGNCGKQVLKDSFTVLLLQKIIIDNNLPKQVCASAQNFTLKSSVNSATWLLNGNPISSIFDPSKANIGQNIIIAKDITGCTIPDTFFISVIDDKATLNAPSTACINSAALTFTATPQGGTFQGNGTVASGIFTPKTAGKGKHQISYTYNIPNSICVAQDSIEIEVFAPNVTFEVSDCESTKITFKPIVIGSISNIYWDFGDSQNSNEKGSVTHEYAKEGTYTVTIKGSFGGCDTTFSKQIAVEAPAFAAFDLPDEICEGVAINLKNNSKGTSLTYEWRVGNTVISSTDIAPQGLLYAVEKDSSLTFNLKISNGCSSSELTKTLKIKALPDAIIGTQLPKYCSGEKIFIQNSSKNAMDFIWKALNGFVSDKKVLDTLTLFADKNPVTYTYWLIAKNSCGSDSTKQNILINPTDVKAFFSVSDNKVCENNSLKINSLATPNAPFQFDMGDGNFYQSATFSHAYAKAGTYKIIQKVLGCGFDTSEFLIKVLALPEVTLTTNDPICKNDVLEVKIGGNGLSVKLFYGDNDSSNLFISKHLYKNSGDYTVSATAYNQEGCVATTSKTITVFALPLVDFEVAPSPCQFAPVVLKSTTTGIDYEFYSGDGNVSDKSICTFRYNQPGLFKPKLILTDANGCRDSITKQILVKDSPKANFEIQNNLACPPITLIINDLSKGAVAYQYAMSNGFLSDEKMPNIGIKTGGKYFLRQVVSNGICSDTITKNTYVKQVPSIAHQVQHISCYGKGDAVISITTKDSTDFLSVISNKNKYAQSGVNRYEPLQKGTYILAAKSIDGCFTHDTARVFEPQQIIVSISKLDTIRLNYGGVDTLKILANKNNLNYLWNTKEGFFKEYSPTLIGISPNENVLYQLRATDDKGCEASTSVFVKVNKRFPVYIPNSFSPNEDDKNDSFTIFANAEDVSEILSFQIYDKWGSQVFEKRNFQPNIEAEGWNGGSFSGGVFVYQALILFKDGTEQVFKGDVTLLK